LTKEFNGLDYAAIVTSGEQGLVGRPGSSNQHCQHGKPQEHARRSAAAAIHRIEALR
jgi:hypothetical protein